MMAEQRQGATRKLIVMGVITSAHGIRGEVKIKSFTEVPEDIATYGPLLLDDGPQEVEIQRLRPAKGAFIARLKGIEDRNAAERLRGRKLKLPRERLPEVQDADTFYYSDLVGLEAVKPDGSPGGKIVAVHDFGSGDLLEIRPEGASETYYLPFTRDAVPHVDIAQGRVVIDPPPELEEDALKRAETGRHVRRRQKKFRHVARKDIRDRSSGASGKPS